MQSNYMKTCFTRPALLVAACFTVALSGCGSLAPVPFEQQEIKARVTQDRVQMYAEQEPVTGAITFHEAAARALKYNLDYKLKLMESALSRSLHDVSTYEMLPRVVAGQVMPGAITIRAAPRSGSRMARFPAAFHLAGA